MIRISPWFQPTPCGLRSLLKPELIGRLCTILVQIKPRSKSGPSSGWETACFFFQGMVFVTNDTELKGLSVTFWYVDQATCHRCHALQCLFGTAHKRIPMCVHVCVTSRKCFRSRDMPGINHSLWHCSDRTILAATLGESIESLNR